MGHGPLNSWVECSPNNGCGWDFSRSDNGHDGPLDAIKTFLNLCFI
jgi:hypothetical protein